jgi:hypothetical protein
MKTFRQFCEQSNTTKRLLRRSGELLKTHKDNPSKVEVYKRLIKSARSRLVPDDGIDYPGRTAARKDKYLIPSYRTDSFPELEGIPTRTKNPKKLRKQKALGEIS